LSVTAPLGATLATSPIRDAARDDRTSINCLAARQGSSPAAGLFRFIDPTGLGMLEGPASHNATACEPDASGQWGACRQMRTAKMQPIGACGLRRR